MPPANSSEALDIVYIFCHSAARDQELRYSLRSVAEFLPFVRKIWIFGDRPKFLSNDASLIEHVPHEFVAPFLGLRTPIRNDFLIQVAAAFIPDLAADLVRFSDDYIILAPLTRAQLCTVRALEDLDQTNVRGQSQFKNQLWRTYDVLKHHGYSGINFESHVPQPHHKKHVWEAYMTFRDFASEDRYSGLVSATTIYNYARKHYELKSIWLAEENSHAGFYGSCPSPAEIAAACRGKQFLNFDDAGYGPDMQRFLKYKFPKPCMFEVPRPVSRAATATLGNNGFKAS